MTKERRYENNELIARFMCKSLQMGCVSDFTGKLPESIVKQFKYHTSWDQLIPVIRKIDKLTENLVIKTSYDYESLCEDIDNAVTSSYYIDEAYEAVIKFIRWYNFKYEKRKKSYDI